MDLWRGPGGEKMNSYTTLSIYQLKPRFQQRLRGLVDHVWHWGVTPNQLTIAAFGLSLLTGIMVYWWHEHLIVFLFVPLVLFIRMALNAMDGMLARTYHLQTPLGAILNELGDVLSDVALYLPFSALGFIPQPLLILIVIGALCTEMTGCLAVQIGATRRYDGPMGKSDRALLFSLYAILIQFGPPNRTLLTVSGVVVLALLLITVINRAVHALQEVER